MKESIAFFGNDLSIQKQLPTAKELFDRQVESFGEQQVKQSLSIENIDI